MADDRSKKVGNRTMQLDAVPDAFELLEGVGEDVEEGGYEAVDDAPSFAPPPLPPRSGAPSGAPPAEKKTSPVVIGVGVLVAIVAIVAGLWVGNVLLDDGPEAGAPAVEAPGGDEGEAAQDEAAQDEAERDEAERDEDVPALEIGPIEISAMEE